MWKTNHNCFNNFSNNNLLFNHWREQEPMSAKSTETTSRTDWERVRNLTDEDIEKAIDSDPNAIRLENCDMSTLRVIAPTKRTQISIKVEPEVLDWYKQNFKPYQTRINAVLRAYMEANYWASIQIKKPFILSDEGLFYWFKIGDHSLLFCIGIYHSIMIRFFYRFKNSIS